MTGPTAPARRRRADAQRNYERLLVIARAAVDESGGDVSLEAVARDAGVAIGTLYNHFPTRQDLLEAVFLDDVHELQRSAGELADAADPLEALTGWLRAQLGFSARGRSMGAAVVSAKHAEGSEIYRANQAMQQAGAVLLERAQAAGVVRPGIGIIEVLRLVYGIGMAIDHAADPAGADKMFAIVVAGIRA